MLPFGMNYSNRMTISGECICKEEISYDPATQIGFGSNRATYCMVRSRTYPSDSTESEVDDTE